jgi:rubrerythrin
VNVFRTVMRSQCSNCSYITEKEETPKRCPYCGELGTMGRKKEAQDFLDEI